MNVIEVDARRLLPPEPMVKILEAVAGLGAHDQVRARTDRRPLHLFPQLEARGLRAECTEEPDGSFVTLIHHA